MWWGRGRGEVNPNFNVIESILISIRIDEKKVSEFNIKLNKVITTPLIYRESK